MAFHQGHFIRSFLTEKWIYSMTVQFRSSDDSVSSGVLEIFNAGQAKQKLWQCSPDCSKKLTKSIKHFVIFFFIYINFQYVSQKVHIIHWIVKDSPVVVNTKYKQVVDTKLQICHSNSVDRLIIVIMKFKQDLFMCSECCT